MLHPIRILRNAWNRLHLLNQQNTVEHMSTQCNDAYRIIQIPQSIQPSLCTSEQDQDEGTKNKVAQYVNIQILSINDARDHHHAAMTQCDTTISTEGTSPDKEDSTPNYQNIEAES